jgi:hypothetical protein
MNRIQKALSNFLTPLVGEVAADMIRQSENPDAGWHITLDRAGRRLAYRFTCPGRTLPGGVHFGCKWTSDDIFADVRLEACKCGKKHLAFNVEATCPSCKTHSNLLDWMRERNFVTNDGLPLWDKLEKRFRIPSRPRGPQGILVGPQMDAEVTYGSDEKLETVKFL